MNTSFLTQASRLAKSLMYMAMLVIAGALLAGCGSSPKVQVEYLTQVTMLKIPAEFKEITAIPSPPYSPTELSSFTTLTPDELAKFNDRLYDYSIQLINHIGEENTIKAKLIDWEAKQLLIYERKP